MATLCITPQCMFPVGPKWTWLHCALHHSVCFQWNLKGKTTLVILWSYQFRTNWFHTLCPKYEEHWHTGARHGGVKLGNRCHSFVILLYDLLVPDTMVKSWGAVSLCRAPWYKTFLCSVWSCLFTREHSGKVLDSRPRGCGFELHRCHCCCALEQDTLILA